MCVCVTITLISHFVPIISKVIGPNTAIHTSFTATEGSTFEKMGHRSSMEKEMERITICMVGFTSSWILQISGCYEQKLIDLVS